MQTIAVSLRVLVVDDNASFGGVLRNAITARGHTCGLVKTAKEALYAVETNTFDVIVSDWHIAQDSGLILLRQVANVSPTTTRVIMSGSQPAGDMGQVAPVAHHVLLKPFKLAELFNAIESSSVAAP